MRLDVFGEKWSAPILRDTLLSSSAAAIRCAIVGSLRRTVVVYRWCKGDGPGRWGKGKPRLLRGFSEWRDRDSNPGHHDFQSCALPTELSRPVQGADLTPCEILGHKVRAIKGEA